MACAGSGAAGEGNANEKSRALAIEPLPQLHLPAHAPHGLLHDGQAQTRASGRMPGAPVKALEHPAAFGGRYARSIVLHHQVQQRASRPTATWPPALW